MPEVKIIIPQWSYYLFAAYTLTWIFIFGYTWILGRRERELAKQLKALETSLRAREAKMGREA